MVVLGAVSVAAGAGRTLAHAAPELRFEVRQTDGPLDQPAADASRHLLVIAHNAGDTEPTTTRAVSAGADAVEIDIARTGNTLVASHTTDVEHSADDPTLRTAEVAWQQAATPTIMLDLKSHDPRTTALVTTLTAAHPGTRVVVCSRDRGALARLTTSPDIALRLISISSATSLRRVLRATTVDPVVQGAAVAAHLLDAATVRALHDRHLWVQAWTVNSMADANRLARWGVDGITTDNLAIVRAMSNPS